MSLEGPRVARPERWDPCEVVRLTTERPSKSWEKREPPGRGGGGRPLSWGSACVSERGAVSRPNQVHFIFKCYNQASDPQGALYGGGPRSQGQDVAEARGDVGDEVEMRGSAEGIGWPDAPYSQKQDGARRPAEKMVS
ncbi:hypothetical protein EYF80_038972 [Liparis tanakae]|uniref:Uncharacterized protein n=1 Tax=Liparis tanakae TaxID=230148 RepID=A0A4Z2GCH6_9TELE|nr:hypothetical protein EYF80_038972 [Liparis tanakae]